MACPLGKLQPDGVTQGSGSWGRRCRKMPFKITLSSPAPISATAQPSNRGPPSMEGQHQSCHKPDYAQGGWVAEKRDGFEQAHGPGGAVVMEKLRDGQIDLRQRRLFTDLVGKV